jgi:two-component system, sensor histidine kinase PdtaS
MIHDETVVRLRRQLNAFAQFTSRSLGKSDLDAVMFDACLRARAGLDVTHAKLLEYAPGRDGLLLRAGAGWKDGYVGRYVASASLDTVIGQAFALSQPIAVEDYNARSDLKFPSILKEHGCVSSLNVPISTDEGTFGVLEVDHMATRLFTDDDIFFLTGLGNSVAQAIQLKRSVIALNGVLQEKQLFARELNHRIKNNLSLVGSMLLLQSRDLAEPTIRQHLGDAVQRINNLALVHDRLQMLSQIDTRIDAQSHFQELAGMLRSLLPPGITLLTECSGEILADCIESITLIANELVTNAAKYAFGGRERGRVVLGYQQQGPGWRLWVEDNGLGKLSDTSKASFGSRLVYTLAARVNAQVYREFTGGTRVEIACGVAPFGLLSPENE